MKRNTFNIPKALGFLFLAYMTVTVLGIAHTLFNAYALNMTAPDTINTVYDFPAYAATVPFHPLYNLILWPLFAMLYFKTTKPENTIKAAIPLGIVWFVAAIAIDTLGWVLIPHPFSMTWKEFFVDYQPWITLIYLTIFVSPFIGVYFHNKKSKTA